MPKDSVGAEDGETVSKTKVVRTARCPRIALALRTVTAVSTIKGVKTGHASGQRLH